MFVRRYIYHFIFLLPFCLLINSSLAQTVSIRTDRNQILIGERIEYDLELNLPSEGYSIGFILPDTISHFEVIEKGHFDTTNNNGVFLLHRKIILTSFDSGSWYIPQLGISLEKKRDVQRFLTDSALINVGYAPADTTNELRDIRPIIEVNVPNYLWYFIGGGVLIAVIIGIIVAVYFIKRKAQPKPVLHSRLTAYSEAMKYLKELSRYNLNAPPDVKQYHTELDLILKKYYSRLININLLNKTTGGFLLKLKELDPTLVSSVAEALRIGDAVKFAKYFPSAADSENCKAQIKTAIEKLEMIKTNKK